MHPSPRSVCSVRHTSMCRSFRPTCNFWGLRSKDEHISTKGLPFGLSLSPAVVAKVAKAALVPLREQGVRILNYLDDWLILAQSQDQLCEHRNLVLSHLSQLGLWINWEKSKLLLTQRISFLSMESDSVDQTAPHAGTCSVSVELLEYLQQQQGGPTESVSEAPGAYGGYSGGHASTLAESRGERGSAALGPSHTGLPPNPWSDLLFLWGVPLEQVSRHAVVYTDASTTG